MGGVEGVGTAALTWIIVGLWLECFWMSAWWVWR